MMNYDADWSGGFSVRIDGDGDEAYERRVYDLLDMVIAPNVLGQALFAALKGTGKKIKIVPYTEEDAKRNGQCNATATAWSPTPDLARPLARAVSKPGVLIGRSLVFAIPGCQKMAYRSIPGARVQRIASSSGRRIVLQPARGFGLLFHTEREARHATISN